MVKSEQVHFQEKQFCHFLLYFSMTYTDFSVKTETDNLRVSNNEIITFDFTVSEKKEFS